MRKHNKLEYKPLIPLQQRKRVRACAKKNAVQSTTFNILLSSYVKNPTSYVTDEDALALVYGDVR